MLYHRIFMFIAIRLLFQDCRHVFLIQYLFANLKEVASHVPQLLRNTVIFTHCTIRIRFLNAALALRNMPSKRRITGQTVRNRLREINPVPTGLQ